MTWWITPLQPVGEFLVPVGLGPLVPVGPPAPPIVAAGPHAITTGSLVQRTWDLLGQGATTFYSTETVVINGLNPAQNLLVLLKPEVLIQRVPVSLMPDQVFIDLRVAAPRLARVQRVTLGDVTVSPPVATQGRVGDLRKTTRLSLRQQRDWFKQRRAFPTHYYRHGLLWVCTWPRSVQPLTLTLVYSALPTALSPGPADQQQVPDLPTQWHSVLPDIASQILLCIEGAGECEAAMQRLSVTLGTEPFKALLKTLRSIRYKQQGVTGGTLVPA